MKDPTKKIFYLNGIEMIHSMKESNELKLIAIH